MRLLEIVRGSATSPAVIATAMALAKRLGKVGVVVGNCPGFVGNRMMFPYMYETQYLVEEGATPQQVDEALTGFGMAMGMFAVDDMAGIDVAIAAQQALGHFSDGPASAAAGAGRAGRDGTAGPEDGQGLVHLRRRPQGRRRIPTVIDLIRARASAAGIAQRAFTSEEIVERDDLRAGQRRRARARRGLRRTAPRTSTSSTSTATDSPRGAAGRCSMPIASVCRRPRTHPALHREHGSRWTPAPLLERLARHAAAPSAGSTPQRRRMIGDATHGCCPPTCWSSGWPTGRSARGRRIRWARIPERLTDRLDHWAATAPDRTFLAERDGRGAWRRLTYAEALDRVRRIAQAFVDRGLSADRTVVILSGNSIDHALLALAAMYMRRAVRAGGARPIRCSCASSRTLGAIVATMRPGLVFADDGARSSGRWARSPRPASRSSTSTPPTLARRRCRARATPPRARRRRARARGPGDGREDPVHVGIDRPAQGRHQHAADAVRQPGADPHGDAVARRRAAGAVRLAAVEPHLRRQPQLRHRAVQRRHALHRRRAAGAGRRWRRPSRTCATSRRPRTSTCRGASSCCCRRSRPTTSFRRHFFSRLGLLFFAAAGLRSEVADRMQALAIETRGAPIPWVTGLGATETAPFALCTGALLLDDDARRRAGAGRRAEGRAGRRAARGARARARTSRRATGATRR